ncbi:MAG: carbohydrate ABC transporter permease, partial [Bacilli bacterium]
MTFMGNRINPKKFHKSQIKFYIILVLVAVFMLLPILFIFAHAFKPVNELYAWPPRFFVRRPSLENFRMLFRITSETGIPFSRYLFNSILVSFLGVVLTVFITSLAAYGLSKLKFRGRLLLFEINTLALMFVPVAVGIPRYFIIARLGLIDNIFAHILPVITMPVALFLVKQFIDQIPNELLESAKIDGASEMQIYLKIILPLIRPAIATVGMLAFQMIWNDVATSGTFFDDESLRTLSFFLANLVGQQG